MVVLALLVRVSPRVLTEREASFGLFQTAALLIPAYLLGVIGFRVSEYVIYPLGWVFRHGVLDGIVGTFPQLQL